MKYGEHFWQGTPTQRAGVPSGMDGARLRRKTGGGTLRCGKKSHIWVIYPATRLAPVTATRIWEWRVRVAEPGRVRVVREHVNYGRPPSPARAYWQKGLGGLVAVPFSPGVCRQTHLARGE